MRPTKRNAPGSGGASIDHAGGREAISKNTESKFTTDFSAGAQAARTIPSTLQNFDLLPDAAEVRLPTLCGLFGISPATAWRRVKAGAIPAPRKFSPGCSSWNVGELRAAKAGAQ